MENSYTTLHRNLDNRIHTLENEIHPNQSLITDLKKQKLRLKDSMVSTSLKNESTLLEKKRIKKHANKLISELKREGKKTRKRVKERKKRSYAVRRTDIRLSG